MHSKQKGNIGELAVSKDLSLMGYPVFKEIGDLSKVDLLTIVQNQALKIQVKFIAAKRNKRLCVSFRKAGPNYRFSYQAGMVDLFAIYCPDNDQVYYLPFEYLVSKHSSGITLSIDGTSKNGQSKGINSAKEWTFENALTYIQKAATLAS
ncbi:MAG: hypothetical protein E6R03_03120 [Hyphomicrobiaceae bacterium]|nr:MAG: hypothetical protein E6R03_03120 [Hyphomicrobiaceae bacterium]